MIGADDELNKELPKVLSFKLKIPSGFHNSFRFVIENKDFDDPDKQVDFCSVNIVRAGNNLPCLHAYDPDFTTTQLSNDTDNTKLVRE